jgi:hypothetical protein
MQLNETRDPTVHDGLSISRCRDTDLDGDQAREYDVRVDCKSVISAWSGR